MHTYTTTNEAMTRPGAPSSSAARGASCRCRHGLITTGSVRRREREGQRRRAGAGTRARRAVGSEEAEREREREAERGASPGPSPGCWDAAISVPDFFRDGVCRVVLVDGGWGFVSPAGRQKLAVSRSEGALDSWRTARRPEGWVERSSEDEKKKKNTKDKAA